MNYGILFLKIAAVFFCLILVLRILGKREVGELSIFDLVVLLIIADIAALGIDNDEFIIPSYFCVFIFKNSSGTKRRFLLENRNPLS